MEEELSLKEEVEEPKQEEYIEESSKFEANLELEQKIESEDTKELKEEEFTISKKEEDEAKIEDKKEELTLIDVVVDKEKTRENMRLELRAAEIEMIETALEIRYSSLKLDRFPIEDTTLKSDVNQIVVRNFGVTDIKIDENYIRGVQVKILKLDNVNYLEFKNREFKLGLEIDLKEDWSFVVVDRNYYYKIYPNKNYIRVKSVLDLIKNIFSAKKLEFFNQELTGSIIAENRIIVMKLELLLKELDELKAKNKEKLLNFDNSFYALSLLNLIESTEVIESWVNLKCDINKIDIQVGDSLNVERVHKLQGNDFDIREKIEILNPICEQEIKNFELRGYRKNCKIYLEKLYKKRGEYGYYGE